MTNHAKDPIWKINLRLMSNTNQAGILKLIILNQKTLHQNQITINKLIDTLPLRKKKPLLLQISVWALEIKIVTLKCIISKAKLKMKNQIGKKIINYLLSKACSKKNDYKGKKNQIFKCKIYKKHQLFKKIIYNNLSLNLQLTK